MTEQVRPEDIEALVAQFDASDCSELHIRFEGFELHLSNDGNAEKIVRNSQSIARIAPSEPSPSPQAPPAATPLAGAAGADGLDGLEIVRAPYLGTFYRAPKPGEPSYVEIGAEVGPDSDLCLVEVMKLFTAVRAGVAGKVARIFATDGAMVESGQPLFAIEPQS